MHATPFTNHVQQALENYIDAEWLGHHSPLAVPYVLGPFLDWTDYPETAQGRGHVVQLLLLRALWMLDAQSLHDQHFLDRDTLKAQVQQGSREQKLVYWKYMHAIRLPVNVLIDQLNVARATFHRDVKQRLPEIVAKLATLVLHMLRPALRSEPVPQTTHFFQRTSVLNDATNLLHEHQQLSVLGPAGSGKTVLAAHLAKSWDGPLIWITLQAGLNDHLSSVLYQLAAALHEYAAHSLWLQLLVDGARIQPAVALGLLRSDCATLGDPGVLICFDQVEIIEHYSLDALQSLLEMLASLPHVVLLMSGTTPALTTVPAYSIPPVASHELLAWAATWALELEPSAVQHIEAFTHGHAHLTALTLLYLQRSQDLSTALQQLAAAPTTERMIKRLLADLAPDERYVLQGLAVITSPVPQHSWPQKVIERLIAQKLIMQATQSTIVLGTLFRQHIYDLLTPAELQGAHQYAATVYQTLGQITLAAHHFVEAGDPLTALQIWLPQREQEIRDGQGYPALRIFERVDATQFAALDHDALIVIRSELRRLVGDAATALKELQTARRSSGLAAYVQQLRGEMLETQGQTHHALDAYHQALKLLGGLPERQYINIHTRIGRIHMNHHRDLALAQQQALAALYSAELFDGEVAAEQGNLQQAESAYQSALTRAEQLRDPLRQARVHFNLAIVAARREHMQVALEHFQRAIHFYTLYGDLLWVARTRTNLAGMYIVAREYATALPIAQEAYAFFEPLNMPYWMAVNGLNISEALCGLGRLVEAEQWVQQTLQLEETSFIPLVLTVLGDIRTAQHRYAEAEQVLHQAITQAVANQDRFAEAPAWRSLGFVYQHQDQAESAHDAWSKALHIFNSLQLFREVERVEQVLAGLAS